MPLQLFSFIAKCLRQFLAGFSSPQRRFPLGFVFPFSCKQTQLDKVGGITLTWVCGHLLPSTSVVLEANSSAMCSPQAELIAWSKGFKCTGVEGKDVVQLLQAAINKEEVGGHEVRGPGWGLPHGGANDAFSLLLASSMWMLLL